MCINAVAIKAFEKFLEFTADRVNTSILSLVGSPWS